MALFRIRSAATYGIDAHLIDVEVDMCPSSNRDFITVGVPDRAVRESRERIKSALINSGFGYPSKSVTIKALMSSGRCSDSLTSALTIYALPSTPSHRQCT